MNDAKDLIQLEERAAPTPVPTSEASAVLSMIERAARDPHVDIDKIERLWTLHEKAQERAEQREASRLFNEAIASAKAEIGPIKKNKHVGFESKRSDAKTDYWHETFAAIAEAVDPVLSRHGLSYRFRSAQDAARLRVTCILSHRGGYSEETTLECGADVSGNKNAIQAIGSAATYLQRYTLKLALGLSAADRDDDGAATGARELEAVTSDQLDVLKSLIVETGSDIAKFCARFKIENVDQISAKDYGVAMALLQQKAKQK